MKDLHYHISIKLYKDERVFGPGIYQLLSLVEQTGSLRAAAMKMEMSYNKAWGIVSMVEKNSGITMLQKQSGGVHGGGAVLTPQAKQLISDYRKYIEEVNAFAKERFDAYFADFREEQP